MTRCTQKNNPVTAMGITRIIASILHNDNLTIVYFDLQPYDCIAHQAWQDEGLSVPPDDVVSRGWSAVLEFLRKVHHCRAAAAFCFPETFLGQPRSLKRLIPSAYLTLATPILYSSINLTLHPGPPHLVSLPYGCRVLSRLWPPLPTSALCAVACAAGAHAVAALLASTRVVPAAVAQCA